MSDLLIHNARVIRPGEGSEASSVLLRDGKIAAIDSPAAAAPDTTRLDAGGRLLTPGLIDVHTHGIGRHLYEQSPVALRLALAELPAHGVTTVLPTLYRVMVPGQLQHLAALAEALPQHPPKHEAQGVNTPGFHLEGPFLAITGAGALTLPGDVKLLEDILAAAQNRVAAMSLSPETPGILPVIERLVECGVRVFLTHTGASVAQTQAAIDAGACHATHFYDVFPLPEEVQRGVRPVGAVETILADARVSVDFIPDGVHVHPMAIRAALAAKGWAGVLAITDSNIGAGMQPGIYPTPWGYPIEVCPRGGARIADPKHPSYGGLAGSSLTMNAGLSNLLGWLSDRPLEQVWATGTLNPARLMGLAGKGRIAAGLDADLVLWEERDHSFSGVGQLHPWRTWISGQCVYGAQTHAIHATHAKETPS